MKAKIINGKIKTGLPKYYKHWAGNFDEQSDEIHKSEGFYDVIRPSINNSTQYLGGIYWDEINEYFTYDVIIKPPLDIEEIRTQKLQQFNNIFDEFTILISRCQLSVDPEDEVLLTKLSDAIAIARDVKKQHLTYLKTESDVDKLNAYQVREEDVIAMKQLFSQFE